MNGIERTNVSDDKFRFVFAMCKVLSELVSGIWIVVNAGGERERGSYVSQLLQRMLIPQTSPHTSPAIGKCMTDRISPRRCLRWAIGGGVYLLTIAVSDVWIKHSTGISLVWNFWLKCAKRKWVIRLSDSPNAFKPKGWCYDAYASRITTQHRWTCCQIVNILHFKVFEKWCGILFCCDMRNVCEWECHRAPGERTHKTWTRLLKSMIQQNTITSLIIYVRMP